MRFETKEEKNKKRLNNERTENVEESFSAEMEKRTLGFDPVSFQPPTVVEVDRFPSGSRTLDKDTVGEHRQYLESFHSTYLH